MYITINNVIGSKTIDLSYLIHSTTGWGKEIAVDSMHSSNSQILLHISIEVLSVTGKKIVLNKGVYTDKELNALIGTELKSQMLNSSNDILRINKLERITKMIISLVHIPIFGGLSGSEDRDGGENSIQFINIGRVGDKSFKE